MAATEGAPHEGWEGRYPGSWVALSASLALRGLVNPLLDSRMSRDRRSRAALSALASRSATPTTAESKGTR